MDYACFLEMAKRPVPMKRIVIPGGQTEGFIKSEIEPAAKVSVTNLFKGKDYARKYQMEDELEDEGIDGAPEQSTSNFNMIEELTSQATIPNIIDLDKEELTQVYENYSFVRKSQPNLLINSYKEEILRQIDVSPVVIIKGQTGCGKTTQVPQFILDSCVSSNIPCNIVVTQPRKIAAISVAKRVCTERSWELGSIVGYQIALDRTASSDTRLLYCTTGVLLQQLIQKKSVSQYTHIIVDEVHERDQETDFLLIILKRFLRHPGCRTKVVLMSATINTNRFVEYFTKKAKDVVLFEPPVIELEPIIQHPVYYYYLDSLIGQVPIKIPDIHCNRPCIEKNMYELACTLVQAFYSIDKKEQPDGDFIGSVLIFLPGLHEIQVLYEALVKKSSEVKEKWWLCPLHSTVTFEEQLKVFKPAPPNHRKVILATNIAESSITVPDVKYVIDFCLMKLQVQDLESTYVSLQLAWISKGQGCQRAGRVGRVMPGRVYRLIPKQMFEELNEDCSPEILRSPLDQLVLKAKELGQGSPASILGRALDPPDLSNIHRTILSLKEMGALLITSNGHYVDDDGDLTYIGHIMAALPLDTHLSKLIIIGHMFSVLNECIIMASAMAVKSMFSSPFKQQLEAYNSKLSWADSSSSDPISFLNAYKVWRYNKNIGKFSRSGGSNEGDWARRYFIQLQSMRDVSRLESEIQQRLKHVGITEQTEHRVKWEENKEKPLILKLVIAGAFYPHYFVRKQVDEKDAVKILGGRDPYSTVFLSNMPLNQPGPLYAKSIKKHFEHCGSLINVTFDGSSKVYLQFGSSTLISNPSEHLNITMPGKIMMAVYRAIKLRHLQIPITLNLLKPPEAEKRFRALFGNSDMNTFCWTQKKELRQKFTNLPGLATNNLEIIITHIESPSQFWAQQSDDSWSKKLLWLHSELNKPGAQVPLTGPCRLGRLCLAPYSDEGKTLYYRARIKAKIPSIKQQKPMVEVFFVDYGNKEFIFENELKDYSEELISKGVRDEPEACIECMLAEILPSVINNPKASWSNEVIKKFKGEFLNLIAVANVYSVVNNVMAINLYKYGVKAGPNSEIPKEESFNALLVNMGFAEFVDEPYLSRENHIVREMAMNSPESLIGGNVVVHSNNPYEEIEDVEPPPLKDCKLKVELKGPKSPLEMTLYSLTRKSQGMEVKVEWSSVNSVLLDTYPMDPHERMLVAASVTQSPSGDRLTLRNTTMMPNIHGLCALSTMIFAPKVELRTDIERTCITGVICGLGCDSDNVPYYSDNDVELPFDTFFDHSDLENINKLRFWMNEIVFGGLKWEEEIARNKVVQAQLKIREFILKVLSKKRSSMGVITSAKPFEWGSVSEEYLLHPRNDEPLEESIYPFIWGVQLAPRVGGNATIIQNLHQLVSFAEGKERMRNGVMCELCQVFLDNVQNLNLHLKSSLHREGEKRILKAVPNHTL